MKYPCGNANKKSIYMNQKHLVSLGLEIKFGSLQHAVGGLHHACLDKNSGLRTDPKMNNISETRNCETRGLVSMSL